MKNIIPLILFFFLYSCETVVNVDLPEHESKLVANSFINPDSLMSIHISNSLSILDNGNLKNIENAIVEVYENNNLVETLQHSSNGNYTSVNKYPAVGNTYQISASANGYDNITTSTIIPAPIAINSFNMKDSVFMDNYGSTQASLNITFNDPHNRNYYLLEIFETDTTADTTFYHPENPFNYYYIYSDDPAIGEEQYGNAILFDDEFFNGKSYQLTVKFDSYFFNANPGSLVYVRLKSANEDFYLYKKTFAAHQQNKGNPFAEPVQVYNNIKNGFGIFGGYSSYTVQIR